MCVFCIIKSFSRIAVKINQLKYFKKDNILRYLLKKRMSFVINLEEITINQSQNNKVLKDVSLKVNKGEFVYLIGKTGSGKSSVLKVLYGELNLVNGSGSVVDFDLNKIKRKQIPFLRRKIGIVFQDFQLLLDRSIVHNMLFVLGATGNKNKKQNEQRAIEALRLVGMETKLNQMPYLLSGGEQQRVAIARALLNKPELILADEPTGNLDPETSEEIMQLLTTLSKEENTAVLMATHDLSMVNKFPRRTIEVKNGELHELNI